MIDREGNVRCSCGAVADVLVAGRWVCIDCVTPERPDMSGSPRHRSEER